MATGLIVPETADRTAAPRPGSMFGPLLARAARAAQWLFGTLTLIVALAVLATIPVLQLLSLGYLLEVAGRVARDGRWRAACVGTDKAAVLGRIALGVTLLMLPPWIVSYLGQSARWIDGSDNGAAGWRLALFVLMTLVSLQIVSACLRGARLRHFLWPRPIVSWRLLTAPGAFARARDASWCFVASLRLPYYFSLGLRGFLAASAWLIVPISLLAASSQMPRGAAIAGLAGAFLLAIVLVYLPFLQAQLAEQNRLRAGFELRALRQRFASAPLAFFVALLATLLLALPLYLLKVEIVPREAAWLPSLLFVVSIFPARVLSGWALARGRRRATPSGWYLRWPARLAMLPVVALYVVVVYLTQYLSWYGLWSLYEQHAFLVPAPFLGL